MNDRKNAATKATAVKNKHGAIEVRLERLAQPDAEIRLRDSKLVVLAPGSIEQHGPHLPLGTDAFAADAIAEQVARKLGGVLVPLPLVGVSPYHLSWPGSLTLKPQTFIAVVDDICECLAQHGVEKVVFVNWHEGNTATLRLSGDSIQRRFNVRVVVANSPFIAHRLFGKRAALTHAGNLEAAGVLMYDPSLVDLSKATNPTPEAEGDRGHEIFREGDFFPIMSDFHEVASTGWYGKPEEATLELAADMLEKVSNYIVEKTRLEFSRVRNIGR